MNEAPQLAPWAVNALIVLITAVAGGVGIAAVRKHNAGARSAEAGAAADADETAASATLWNHYQKELEDMRVEIRALGERLSKTEAELASKSEEHKYAVAGERRYREAFAELLMIYTDYVASARSIVPIDITRLADQRLSALVMTLARPIYADKDTDNGEPQN